MTHSFERLKIGDKVETPTLHLAEENVRPMIRWAGYIHPLFSDPDYPATVGLPGCMVPGEVILLVAGGLAEQVDVFDDSTIALVEFESVQFKKPALVGDTLRLLMEVVDKRVSPSGRRGFIKFDWSCVNQDSQVLIKAAPIVAFKLPMAPSAAS